MFNVGDIISKPRSWGSAKYCIVSVEYEEEYCCYRTTVYNLANPAHPFQYTINQEEAQNIVIEREDGPVSKVERKIAMMWQRQPYVKKAAEVCNV
jgi:hypothetical protein